ncbi:MAG: allophanate hydrolase, partial [Comamonadaceae bacterium]
LEGFRNLGAEIVSIDFTPFSELAALLYAGPWVAERFVAVERLWRENPDAINPVVRSIVEQGAQYDASATFKAEYRRAALARVINDSLAGFDALLVPTSPSIYTLEQMRADPIGLNSRFGTYTNFTNLADLCALAVPSSMRADGLPAGITLIAPAWHDHTIAAIGALWQRARALPMGATGKPIPAPAREDTPSVAPAPPVAPDHIRVAVVGAHLTGMPLNHQLTSRDAVRVQATETAGDYRLYALANTTPPKPGLVRADSGRPIAVELWDMPSAAFGSFVAEIPAPLGIGTLTLHDGREVKGFICEPRGLTGARDITVFGGWRAYLSSLSSSPAH